ncbi:GPI-anchored protein LLG1-like [Cucurbita moschata]|uniref:GPI-anchored protein LLG1-like n=1 Tax=Cucurbita moschata TaxID=3662 RepID=A0A6J1FD10_CUCMO|nr:GPI-anchored protein LLG1-like [Cucurbita moschata]
MKKMDSNPCFFLFLLLLPSILFTAVAATAATVPASSPTSPSACPPVEAEYCPVEFEFMNYSIITSKCKGPEYPANLCCSALEEFGCPYANYINDLTNNCASIMFTYIHLYGNYPSGLFASLCVKESSGLQCSKPN